MDTLMEKTCCRALLLFFGIIFCVPPPRALENGLALTPPMGWNSWNRFACNVTEDLVKAAAAPVSSGMKDSGYEYVVIDDCWQVTNARDSGQLLAGAWSHLIALRHGATSALLIGVRSHMITRCRATANRLGPLSWSSCAGAGGISAGVSQ